MKTNRYLLVYMGEGAMPSADVAYFRASSHVLDQSRRCLLVDDQAEHLRELLRIKHQWQFQPEQLRKPLAS
ncbi:hypothetical protein [Spirosoma sp. KNUC1025]|uniref:hypothetical protein n=1 Tax=Spirosoma sp. KNUC1025 TaxID=2894082 RepID=UPI00386CB5B4|nr:hypothetical protein LN737_14040 [Spirosoma sp. KNUC1025]